MGTTTVQLFIIKGLFETRNNYPNAYTTTVRFRTWLNNEYMNNLERLSQMLRFSLKQ